MKNKFAFLTLLLIFLSPIFASQNSVKNSAQDLSKNQNTIEQFSNQIKTPKSVVALSKSVAQMWLLAGGTLSGCTSDALELPEINPEVISVGTLTTTSLESIFSLKPDFVILTKDIPIHKNLKTNLENLGVQVYVVDVKSFSDYEDVMKDFTSLTCRNDLYKKNVQDVKENFSKFIEKAKLKNPEKKLTYIFFRVSATKNKILKEHFANEIFQNLNLQNVISDKNSLTELNAESLLSYNPNIIFVVSQGNEKKAKDIFCQVFEKNPIWSQLSAVKNKRVYILPKELFNYKPNNNWNKAYAYIFNLIYAD